MRKRILILAVLLVVITLVASVPALASTPTTYMNSQGFSVTLDAANANSYQISLMGNSLDFTSSGPNQMVSSQSPLYIYNSGTRNFDVYVSADGSPSNGWYSLSFSDSPGQDQLRWTLTPYSWPGMDTSVTDSWASNFGTLSPSSGMTLYSNLYMGNGLTYDGHYTWSGTVYAVPGM